MACPLRLPGSFVFVVWATATQRMCVQVTHAEMKRWCARRWWPTLALSKELQLPDIEAGLRTEPLFAKALPALNVSAGVPCVSQPRRMILDLPNQVPLDMTWALLPMAHAHDLKEEVHHCAEAWFVTDFDSFWLQFSKTSSVQKLLKPCAVGLSICTVKLEICLWIPSGLGPT